MRRPSHIALMFLVGVAAGCGGNSPVQQKAPPEVPMPILPKPDKVVDSLTPKIDRELEEALQVPIKKGQATYPQAKNSFMEGLPTGDTFLVLVRLKDASGAGERVLMEVMEISDGRVRGSIFSPILVVKTFKKGEEHSVPEAEVLDWVIVGRDGRERGNEVGKFLEEWEKTKSR